MTDQIRAALIAFTQSLFPLLVLLHLVSPDPSVQAAVMLAITNGITVVALLFKKGQAAG